MKLSEKNKWWQRALKKEELRNVNRPKAPKHNRWMTPTNFSTLTETPQRHAR